MPSHSGGGRIRRQRVEEDCWTPRRNMEKHFLRPLFAGCSQSHLSGDPLFKPLLANFALFATPLFLWTLMIHDEVDLTLPSEAVLCTTMNATSLEKLMKLIKTRLGE